MFNQLLEEYRNDHTAIACIKKAIAVTDGEYTDIINEAWAINRVLADDINAVSLALSQF